MRSRILREVETHPLRLLLFVGLGLRLLAVIFARGYMATDDHNQVIELAAQWLRGGNDYLAGGSQFYRSLLYPCLNYLQISFCHALGIVHPDAVMFINRLLHAALSLWTIVLTYRLGNRLADRQTAFMAGLVVAAGAVMPYASVRNLIEVVCIPFLLSGIYEVVCAIQDSSLTAGALSVIDAKSKSASMTSPPEGEKNNLVPDRRARTLFLHWLWAGLAFGIAFLIRWQVASAFAGVGIYLLFKRQWRGLAFLTLTFLVPVMLEGLWDWQAHGIFLGSLWRYIEHNAIHAYDYVVGPWYRYLLLIIGIFIPPFSLLCLYAGGRYIRRLGILAWAVIPFLIVHSLVPGKQERFMLPIVPEIALLFVMALWHWQREQESARRWIRYGWRWFWAINVMLLIGALTHYGQRGKIEPLIGIFEQGDAIGVIVDLSERGRRTDLPLFYLDGGGVREMPQVFQATQLTQIDSLLESGQEWNYLIYFGSSDRGAQALSGRYGRRMELVRHTGPTLIEQALLYFNPKYTHSRESWLLRVGQ